MRQFLLQAQIIMIVLLLFAQSVFGFDFIFSNKKYSEKISIEARIASNSKLETLLQNNDKDLGRIPIETVQQLRQKQTYLFVRLKNNGNMGAWGSLSCDLNTGSRIMIDEPFLSSNMYSWSHYIISTDGIIFSKSGNKDTPIVKCKWDKLYSK